MERNSDIRTQLEEAQEKIKFLEETIYTFVISEGYYIPEGLEYLFVDE